MTETKTHDLKPGDEVEINHKVGPASLAVTIEHLDDGLRVEITLPPGASTRLKMGKGLVRLTLDEVDDPDYSGIHLVPAASR